MGLFDGFVNGAREPKFIGSGGFLKHVGTANEFDPVEPPLAEMSTDLKRGKGDKETGK